jgi:hypothetical protein
LREANEPLPTRVIAWRGLPAKGVVYPDRQTLKVTRTRPVLLSKLGARGVTRKVWAGNCHAPGIGRRTREGRASVGGKDARPDLQ